MVQVAQDKPYESWSAKVPMAKHTADLTPPPTNGIAELKNKLKTEIK